MTARMWGTRPSRLLAMEDDVVAYALDEALALRIALEANQPAAPATRSRLKGPAIPEGTRYLTVADIEAAQRG